MKNIGTCIKSDFFDFCDEFFLYALVSTVKKYNKPYLYI